MDKSFYYKKLYPLQNIILKTITPLNSGFYLTGGTALSRVYTHHRFSDDFDFFVNDTKDFNIRAQQILDALLHLPHMHIAIQLRDERFLRFTISEKDTLLKIEMINDVPSHIGNIIKHPKLGLVDSAENILANKITALVDRHEPKDMADIWALCTKMNLSLEKAITNAESKAAGIFPADIARILCTANITDWEIIKWIKPPSSKRYLSALRILGESLIII